jgi:hypothetical protein
MTYQLVKRTENAKLGANASVTASSKDTCPKCCPWIGAGCYASSGFHTNQNWTRVTSGQYGTPWPEFLDAIKALPAERVLRLNQAGDLDGNPHTLKLDMARNLRLDSAIGART